MLENCIACDVRDSYTLQLHLLASNHLHATVDEAIALVLSKSYFVLFLIDDNDTVLGHFTPVSHSSKRAVKRHLLNRDTLDWDKLRIGVSTQRRLTIFTARPNVVHHLEHAVSWDSLR